MKVTTYKHTNKFAKGSETIANEIKKQNQEKYCRPIYVLRSLFTALYLKFQNVNQSCSCL